jgi:acyl carrier protein
MALTDHGLIGYLSNLTGGGDVLEAESPLFSTGMLDSVSMLNLIAFVEEQAAIQVRSEDVTLDNFDTPGRIVRFAQAQA